MTAMLSVYSLKQKSFLILCEYWSTDTWVSSRPILKSLENSMTNSTCSSNSALVILREESITNTMSTPCSQPSRPAASCTKLASSKTTHVYRNVFILPAQRPVLVLETQLYFQ